MPLPNREDPTSSLSPFGARLDGRRIGGGQLNAGAAKVPQDPPKNDMAVCHFKGGRPRAMAFSHASGG